MADYSIPEGCAPGTYKLVRDYFVANYLDGDDAGVVSVSARNLADDIAEMFSVDAWRAAENQALLVELRKSQSAVSQGSQDGAKMAEAKGGNVKCPICRMAPCYCGTEYTDDEMAQMEASVAALDDGDFYQSWKPPSDCQRMRDALLKLEQWDMLTLDSDGHGAVTSDAPWARKLIADALRCKGDAE